MITAIDVEKGRGYHSSKIAFFRRYHWHTYSLDTEARADRAQRVANELIKRGAQVRISYGYIAIIWRIDDDYYPYN